MEEQLERQAAVMESGDESSWGAATLYLHLVNLDYLVVYRASCMITRRRPVRVGVFPDGVGETPVASAIVRFAIVYCMPGLLYRHE